MAGASDLNGLDIARSLPAKLTRGVVASSPGAIPAASCTTMCEASPPSACAPTSVPYPMSSSDLPPARKSQPQTAKERALRTITCSGNGCASSSRSDLFGARLRIALAQELMVSTGYSMRWLRQATPHGHAWWVLTAPGRTTGESGCGLLLPTPMGGSRAERGGTPMDASAWARERMAGFLGTPRSSAGYDSDEFSGGAAPNPRKLIYETILPTPTARDSRSDRASPETMAKNSRPLSETSGSLGLTGTAACPVSQRRALLLGLVLWMMGQTPDFLQACATVPLPRSATP